VLLSPLLTYLDVVLSEPVTGNNDEYSSALYGGGFLTTTATDNMVSDYCKCNFENAILCRKTCDKQVLAKYAIAYAIAYSHITSMPT